MMHWKTILFSLVAAFFLVACGSSLWQIRDRNDQVITLADPEFSPKEVLRLRVGDAFRDIEAKEIVTLVMIDSLPRELRDGSIWMPCSLELSDGTKYSQQAFLLVEGSLMGRVGRHKAGIALADLASFGTYLPKKDTTATDTTNKAADSTKIKMAPGDSTSLKADTLAKKDTVAKADTVIKDSTK